MLPLNQQVRIYFNLHKKKLSVQAKVNKRWKVVAHVEEAYLKNASFKVSEAGRQRVIKEKKKNVHAFIVGTLVDDVEYHNAFQSVRYNPYEVSQFQCEDKDILQAEEVIINGRKVFAAVWLKFMGRKSPLNLYAKNVRKMRKNKLKKTVDVLKKNGNFYSCEGRNA